MKKAFTSTNYDDMQLVVTPFSRTQADGLGDKFSREAAIDCSADKDMTRQEFKEETDINVLLKKFGLNQQSRPLIYGEFDYTIDYQQALQSVDDARKAHARMPAEIREKYPTTNTMLEGMASGALAKDLEDLSMTKQQAAQHAAIENEIEKELKKTQILRDRQAAIMAEKFRQDPEAFAQQNPKGTQKE